MRLNPLAIVFALLLGYIGLRLLGPFGWAVQAGGAVLLMVLFVLLPKGFYLGSRSPWAVMASWIATGFFSWLLVLTFLRDLALLFGATAELSAIAVLALAPLITTIGFVMATMRPRVVDVDVPIEGLPKNL